MGPLRALSHYALPGCYRCITWPQVAHLHDPNQQPCVLSLHRFSTAGTRRTRSRRHENLFSLFSEELIPGIDSEKDRLPPDAAGPEGPDRVDPEGREIRGEADVEALLDREAGPLTGVIFPPGECEAVQMAGSLERKGNARTHA